MNFMVVGLGSMGKRRIRLIQQLNEGHNIIGIDSNEERRKEVHNAFNIEVCASIKEAAAKCDAAFISTSPLAHSAIIKECLNHNLHVFTEINLNAEGYQENMALANEKNLQLFLSSTMQYRREIEYMKEHINLENNAYTYHVGQYLPDWHPWESYQNFFVGHKESNGCRELLAIELPWIISTFGKIEDMHIIKSKKTNLKIDYPDTYHLIIKHENNNTGTITIDLVARKAIRTLEILAENYHFFWQGKPDSLQEYNLRTNMLENIKVYNDINKNANYSENIIENAYLDEITAFIECLKNNQNPYYSFKEDLYTQQIIQEIEEA